MFKSSSQSNLQDSTSPKAIVIGLDGMSGIQAARILAHHRVPVIALAKGPKHPYCRTNVCEEILFVDTESEECIRTLETLGPQLKHKAVLFPCTDMSVWLISRHRQRLEGAYHVVLSEPDVIEMLMDKVSFCTYAQEEGFSIPETFFLHCRADAEQGANKLAFPCILKPAMRTADWQRHTEDRVYKVSSPEEFLALYDRWAQWTDVLMAQEWIEGPDANLYSCNCYFNADSQPVVTFVARKLRQWPPVAGTSCLGEECRNDVVLQETIRLFRSVRYRGLGYLEMKRDEHTGKHFIIEANIGRPTGRSAIAEAGGVELLYAMYCDAIGRPLPANLEQKYDGVKWVYLRRDLQSALYYWRRGELTLREWWQSWRGRKAYVLFSWTDPAPFWADLQRAIGVLVKRNKHRRSKAYPSSL